MSEDLFGFEQPPATAQPQKPAKLKNGSGSTAAKSSRDNTGAGQKDVGATRSSHADTPAQQATAARQPAKLKNSSGTTAAKSSHDNTGVKQEGVSTATPDHTDMPGRRATVAEQPATDMYFWQQPAWQRLQLQRLPHALLIHAAAGYGLDDFADRLCRILLANSAADTALFDSGNHPELMVLEPDGNTIGVAMVRAGISWLSVRSINSEQRRILMLRQADRMPVGAANAILKCLEEPPADGLILLLSSRPSELPATINSRCVKLCPCDADSGQINAWLQSRLPQEQMAAANILQAAGFGPLEIINQLDDQGLHVRTAIFKFLTAPSSQAAITILAKSWQAADTGKALLWLRVMLLAAIREHLGDPGANGLAARLPVQELPLLLDFYQQIVQSERIYHGRSGVNELSLLEGLMLRWIIS